jgi:hypothetical protein
MEREKDVADLKARIERLDKLARGFFLEVGRWRGANDPLLYRERKAYLGAVQDALAGVEAARVVLVGVVRRIEGVSG